MAEDRRSETFKRFAWFWVRRAMRRKFYNVIGWNADALRAAERKGPVILYSNHSSWWDAFVDHMLERVFELNHFSLVDERTLQSQAWLLKIGALGVDVEDPARAISGLRAAVRFLNGGPREGRQPVLIIFPQGRMASASRRPLGFQEGLAWLKKTAPRAQLIPLARRFEFLKEDRPQILLDFGEVVEPPGDISSAEMTEWLERRLIEKLDRLEQRLSEFNVTGAETLLSGSLSINKQWEWLQRFFTGRLGGFSASN